MIIIEIVVVVLLAPGDNANHPHPSNIDRGLFNSLVCALVLQLGTSDLEHVYIILLYVNIILLYVNIFFV